MEPFANHFDFRHAVDDSNNLRHSTPSFEETWVTRQWPIRVFSFFLALSEVNTFCAYRYFVWKTDEEQLILHQFCRKLALDFINNAYISQGGVDGDGDGRRKRNRSYVCHALKTAPPHAKRWTGKNGMFQQLLGTSNMSVAAKIASSPSEPTAIVIQDYGCVVYVM